LQQRYKLAVLPTSNTVHFQDELLVFPTVTAAAYPQTGFVSYEKQCSLSTKAAADSMQTGLASHAISAAYVQTARTSCENNCSPLPVGLVSHDKQRSFQGKLVTN